MMKFRILRFTRLPTTTLFSVVAVLTLLAGCVKSEWHELAISDGAFSVLMRGEPLYVRQQLNTPSGKMFAHLYSSDRPDSFFAIGYSDYPLSLVVGSSPEQLFSGVRDTWLRRIDGKLVAQDTRLKLNGAYPGAQFEAKGTVNGVDTIMQARLYLVDQRLYQLIALNRKSEVSQGVINRFLNSFKLIPQSETGTLQIAPPAN